MMRSEGRESEEEGWKRWKGGETGWKGRWTRKEKRVRWMRFKKRGRGKGMSKEGGGKNIIGLGGKESETCGK